MARRGMEYHEVVSSSELLLVNAQTAKDDHSSLALVYSGDYCRICFSLRTHFTSSCPYLISRPKPALERPEIVVSQLSYATLDLLRDIAVSANVVDRVISFTVKGLDRRSKREQEHAIPIAHGQDNLIQPAPGQDNGNEYRILQQFCSVAPAHQTVYL